MFLHGLLPPQTLMPSKLGPRVNVDRWLRMFVRAHGKTPFSVYQGRWNVMHRDFERDILPMAKMFGMALAPWDVMGGGHIKSPQQVSTRCLTVSSFKRDFSNPHLFL